MKLGSFPEILWKIALRSNSLQDLLKSSFPEIQRHWAITGIAVYQIQIDKMAVEILASSGEVPNTHQRKLNEKQLRDYTSCWQSSAISNPSCSTTEDRNLARLLSDRPNASTKPLSVQNCFVAFEYSHESTPSFMTDLLEIFSLCLKRDLQICELRHEKDLADANRLQWGRSSGNYSGETQKIIGASNGLKPIFEKITIVSPTDLPVLLLGETGSGKEVIARAIHERSARHSLPFIRVNCGAISPNLIDSELFGHEKGSFTGATNYHKGWFERANGGTLFLDEIGEMPEAAQVRLLRVLQDGTFDRVGGEKSIKVDVRVVTATHRDLTSMVRAAKFRQDLWYRISVFPIEIPSLSNRLEDIPDLSRHFISKAAQKFGVPTPPLLTEDIALMTDYSWPGNIRELISVIERAVLLGRGQTLEIRTALGMADSHPTRARPESTETTDRSTEEVTLNEHTRRHIETVLRKTRGRVEGPFGAARELGINPHTLRSRMKKLGIDWTLFRGTPKNEGEPIESEL